MHLDCSRHFWTIEETKRYIDVMVAYKLNRLHWHLTDDQGWRIEIKSYPRLTEVGSIRKETQVAHWRDSLDHKEYGGFYTQEEVRDVVAYAKERGITVEHYILSSGLKEMIEGTSIAKCFENIYACSFLYNVDGVAYWPAVAVDYTTKTQFLFKINKGIKEISDNKRINEYVAKEDRPIPFERMIYLGDGETDVPCMSVVKEQGGHSIAVYGNRKKKAVAERLIKENRVNFVCKADYSENSEIYTTVRLILDKIRADYDFQQHLIAQKQSLKS